MKESDIRPQKLLDTYLELSAQDAVQLFSRGKRSTINCVSCNNTKNIFLFSKNGFDYARCEFCGTLYQTPRPSFKAFERFYTNSVSSEFWAKEFFPKVAKTRQKSIFAPRAAKLYAILKTKGFSPETIADIGAGHGIFLTEMTKRFSLSKGIAIEPSHEMAEICRSKGFETYESLAEDVTSLNESVSLTSCLEVMEHVHDPLTFLLNLVAFTQPGGYVFFTTLGADGFDIRLLGKNANAVFPPHHLNFMSINGLEILCKRAGLVDIEITTPGKLDIDIVRNKLSESPEILQGCEFLELILNDEDKSTAFQEFLACNQLSSHVWVLARKPA